MDINDLATHVKDPARLAALHNIALLDTPTEEAFDRLSKLAARFINAPIALITLVDANRQFFKSCIGLPEPWLSRRETPLSHSFCQHNRFADQPLLVEDARLHPVSRDNPAIRDLKVIAYLGIPLITSDGYVLGSFCVIDSTPRQWSKEEVETIQELASAVMTEIQLRTEISARHMAEAQSDDLTQLTELLQIEVTAREKAEEQLRNLNDELERKVERRTQALQAKHSQYLHAEKLAAIGQLSASIAHEFNNPLQGVMTILKGLKKIPILEEEDVEMLDLAIAESQRMKNLIRNLQDFNKPSPEKKAIMDVHASIDSLLLLCKSDFRRKNVSVVLNYTEQSPQIMAIPDQIKQVFLNLLYNAADACQKSGGVITISTCHDKEKIAVTIKDNGIGIKPGNINQIFLPFYTFKTGVQGTGLGLSVCQSIVQAHKGEIRVESQPGKGSTFTVLLPIDE